MQAHIPYIGVQRSTFFVLYVFYKKSGYMGLSGASFKKSSLVLNLLIQRLSVKNNVPSSFQKVRRYQLYPKSNFTNF
jgi:hypothetical protein